MGLMRDECIRPLFSKDRFPNLKWLGIVDAEEQNTVVEMFLNRISCRNWKQWIFPPVC